MTKLKSHTVGSVSVAEVVATKGRSLHAGFMDEFDIEAEKHAAAILRSRQLTPRKIGRKASTFYRPQFSPNAL